MIRPAREMLILISTCSSRPSQTSQPCTSWTGSYPICPPDATHACSVKAQHIKGTTCGLDDNSRVLPGEPRPGTCASGSQHSSKSEGVTTGTIRHASCAPRPESGVRCVERLEITMEVESPHRDTFGSHRDHQSWELIACDEFSASNEVLQRSRRTAFPPEVRACPMDAKALPPAAAAGPIARIPVAIVEATTRPRHQRYPLQHCLR